MGASPGFALKNSLFCLPSVRALRVMVIVALFSLCGCGESDETWLPTDRFVKNVTVIDVVDGVARPNQTIVIREDRILAVRDAEDVRISDASQILQSGGHVIPGLWDMHVHALSDPDDAIDRSLPLFIANGITGVRDMGSLVPGIVETRARLERDPSLPAPELFVAGPLLDGVKLPWYGDLPLLLDDAASAERELPRLLEQGVDFFKVYDQLSRPAYDAVLAYAAENDVLVAGHAPESVGVLEAATAGQSTIEHLSLFSLRECVAEPRAWFDRAINAKFSGEYVNYYRTVTAFYEAIDQERCDEVYRAMAEAGSYFTPTLVMEFNDRARVDEDALAYLGSGAIDWCEQGLAKMDGADPAARDDAYAAMHAQFERMRDAGVSFLAGSDTPNNCLAPGFSLHWELEQLVEAGLAPIDALRAATSDAAAAIGRDADSGRIQAGYRADLVVLGGDPLQQIRNTRHIRGVLQNGRWYDESALNALRADAAAAVREAADPVTE